MLGNIYGCLSSRSCSCPKHICCRRLCQFLCPLPVYHKSVCNQNLGMKFGMNLFLVPIQCPRSKQKLKWNNKHFRGNWSSKNILNNNFLPNKNDVKTFIISRISYSLLTCVSHVTSSAVNDKIRTGEPLSHLNWYLYKIAIKLFVLLIKSPLNIAELMFHSELSLIAELIAVKTYWRNFSIAGLNMNDWRWSSQWFSLSYVFTLSHGVERKLPDHKLSVVLKQKVEHQRHHIAKYWKNIEIIQVWWFGDSYSFFDLSLRLHKQF